MTTFQPWRDLAACVGVPHDVMFPPADGPRAADYSAAKAICQPCPVKAECLDYALTGEHGMFGCWGGTSPRERRTIRRQRNLGDVVILDITQITLDI